MIFNRIESKKSIAICLLALVGSNFSCQPNSRFFLLLLLLLLLFRFNFLFHYSFQCLPWLTSEWLLLACLCFIELLNLSVVFHFLYRFLFWFFWFRIQFGFFFSFFFFSLRYSNDYGPTWIIINLKSKAKDRRSTNQKIG